MGKRESFGRPDGQPTDMLGDTVRAGITIEADHAEQCEAFDQAAAAHALLADRARWNKYLKLARNLRFGEEAEAMVFLAAAAPVPTMGRKAKDPVSAWLYAQADAAGHGPHSRAHGAAVLALPPHDPTNGLGYDIAGGIDHHAAGGKAPHSKAPCQVISKDAAPRTLREHAQKRRDAREAGQGFFCGLAFRTPSESDDDLIPEGA